MNERHQMELLLGAVRDYQDGLMPLGMLVDKIEGILNILQNKTIQEDFFSPLLALEEVHARMQIGDFDYELDGKPVVGRALNEMINRTETFLASIAQI